MIRCGEHGEDLSSEVGVCSSCLRERLATVLIARQKQLQIHHQEPPLLFPRAVSPYVSRRKSEYNESDMATKKKFFPTPPQIPHNRRRFIHFTLFRSKSDISGSETPRSSTSWLSLLFSPKRNHRFSISRKSSRHVRSPAKSRSSWCSATEKGEKHRRDWQASSPPATAGFGMCISNLVWSTPQRYASNHSKHQNSGALDRGTGDMPATVTYNINRSRKLADMGRCKNSL